MRLTNLVLIDPDIYFAQDFIRKMNSIGQFEVHHFLSFEQAFINVTDIAPEIIFTECQLNDKQGVQIIAELLQRSPVSQLVMLSNEKDIQLIEAVYNAGAFKYFSKDILIMSQIEGLLRSNYQIVDKQVSRISYAQ